MSSTRLTLALAGLLAAAAQAHAASGTLDTSAAFSPTNLSADGVTYYNAPAAGPFPSGAFTVGEFDFSVGAGLGVSAATLTGDFGSDTLGSGTAPVDLYVGSVLVASCDAACAGATDAADVAWSYTFAPTQLAALNSGKLVLTAVQNDVSQVVLDPTTADVTVSAVPEPASGLLMFAGLLPLAAVALRRRARRDQA